MLSRDSQGGGFTRVAAQAGLCATLALVFTLGGDRAAGIERGFLDLWQRASAAPSAAPVIIVAPTSTSAPLWSLPELPELIAVLKDAGAKSIVAAGAPPAPIRAAELNRLQSLIGLEQRRGLAGEAKADELRRQLSTMQQELRQQELLAGAMSAAGNVVLGLGVTERRPGVTGIDGACGARIAAADQVGPSHQEVSRLDVVPAPAGQCNAAAGIGHLGFAPDRDGLIRRAPRAIVTSRGRVMPVAAAASAFSTGRTAAQPVDTRSGPLLRFYRGPEGESGIPVVDARQLLVGEVMGRVKGSHVVIGTPVEATAGLQSPLLPDASLASFIATDLANQLTGGHIQRPGWALLAEVALALLLAAGTVLTARLNLGVAALVAVGASAGLLGVEYLLLALAGIWLKLAGLALYCLTGVAVLHLLVQLPGQRALGGQPAEEPKPPSEPGTPSEELDLAFSVLRQQPTTEKTKQQLYALAMEHGRHRDYARAERVFRHLAARDPGYRDVAAKLEKLSGARGAPPGPARPAKAAPPPNPQPAAAPVPAGRTLGRYELERVIGRGAMATVYLGRDPTINRRVAIKTLPLAEEFADNDLATARSHFLREAESAGRLNHPDIISIHDAGEDQRVAYLAMEYFEGKPMSHYAQVGRLLPPRVVIDVMARAAEALHYAHSQNVVHRDVKPANLLYDDRQDRLKLTDFGIARLTDSSRTRTGIILGTPSYMSPEQLSASRVSGLSDLYSLGVTMYHLLTGSPPFQADSIPRLMDKIVNQRHRPVTDLRDDVPAAIDEVLDRAMAKDPADRYQSGKAMALALRECCRTFPAEVI